MMLREKPAKSRLRPGLAALQVGDQRMALLGQQPDYVLATAGDVFPKAAANLILVTGLDRVEDLQVLAMRFPGAISRPSAINAQELDVGINRLGQRPDALIP